MAELPAELGPAEPIGTHAGVSVARVAAGIVKVYDDPLRAERERAALGAALPGVSPQLLRSGPSWNLQSDVRTGRDPRCRRLPDAAAAPAAALLAGVHALRVPDSLGAADHARTLAERVAAAGPELIGLFEGMTIVGDAFCHFDLHPSNWILDRGLPVGLLDWTSSGHGDPEEDLAGLIRATAGGLANQDVVCRSWQAAAGRPVDVRRVEAYLALLAAELGGDVPVPGTDVPFHGQRRTRRCVDKIEHPVAHWLPLAAPDVDQVLASQGLSGATVTHGFAQHACNDVLRVAWRGERHVLKVYNKPVGPWLFALERQLAAGLAGTSATVLASRVLPSGGHLLRVGDRLGGLYPDIGDKRVGTTASDLARLAVAHAALLALGPLGPDPGIDRNGGDDLGTLALLRVRLGADRLAPETWALLEAAAEGVDDPLSGLPESLVHGALHRDHLGRDADGRVVFFDLEKARRGPRIRCVAHTAYHAAYRSNDEQLDPRKLVFYVRELHRTCPLLPAEVEQLVPALLRCFVRDVSAFFEDGDAGEGLPRHLDALREVHHNRSNLESALRTHLGM